MGLASAGAPSAVKQGGGVMNQLSSNPQGAGSDGAFTPPDPSREGGLRERGERRERDEGGHATWERPALVLRRLRERGAESPVREGGVAISHPDSTL